MDSVKVLLDHLYEEISAKIGALTKEKRIPVSQRIKALEELMEDLRAQIRILKKEV
jgi:hypothetical protein